MSLRDYRLKRDFTRTPEPRAARRASRGQPRFVVHKHHARTLHYDLRLEHGGVLLSWAVPKGPPLVPGERRLAVRTEDHPLAYATFEGRIPEGAYGAGSVEIWDRGTWEPLEPVAAAIRRGKLPISLEGERLHGRWVFVRLAQGRSRGKREWLLIKRSDSPQRAAKRKTTARAKRKRRAPSAIPGAVRAAFPRRPAPQLCKLASEPPHGEGWVHEVKLDGYRLMASIRDGQVRLITRSGEDWSARFAHIARSLAALAVDEAVVDGEVVVVGDRGVSDFQRLQNSLAEGGKSPIFFAFDLPHFGGWDLSRCKLLDRKQALQELLRPLPTEGCVQFLEHTAGDGAVFLESACRVGLEGIVSKRADGPYLAGERRGWIKTKCLRRQEFVVGGWSDPSGSRRHLGALLVGYYDPAGRLCYAGKVGAGFTEASLDELSVRLARLARRTPPFADPPEGAAARSAHWVSPRCVVEVTFTEWTSDGRLRHPVFHGLRDDKRARQVTRERADSPRAGAIAAERSGPDARHGPIAGVQLSHPDRVLIPDPGVTKLELASYYQAVAGRLLPHVVDRPLSIVRCPEGQGVACFYQKHPAGDLPASIDAIEVPGSRPYLGIHDLAGLIELVQRGAIELHPWGARRDLLGRPDRIVIDLDPGPGVAWGRLVRAAHDLRALAQELGLVAFARTTGGKGLHVVLPIARRSTWDEAKSTARALGQALARRDERAFVLSASKRLRRGRIFVDYLRNARGATAVASYSARARPGAAVATPVAWDELTAALDPGRFDVRSVLERLESAADPWADYFEVRQALTRRILAAVESLG